VLHALEFGRSQHLLNWLDKRPNNAITVLDTHDGIGIIDIGADETDPENNPGLVPQHELDELVERIHQNSNGESRLASGAAASNIDLYQVNCTFYDALARNDSAYLIARAIQFFVPGIPQVYYVGLLAGENDMTLLERTQAGRDINRHYYDRDEVLSQLERPVVQQLNALIRLRNSHAAFNGTFSSNAPAAHQLTLIWTNGDAQARLDVDLHAKTGSVKFSTPSATDALKIG
jgi:sucrose phosphorylase